VDPNPHFRSFNTIIRDVFFYLKGTGGAQSIFKDFGLGKPKNYAIVKRQRQFLIPNCALERNTAFFHLTKRGLSSDIFIYR
jgi:hypothetical protein